MTSVETHFVQGCGDTLRSRTHEEEASCGRAEVVGPRRGEATRANLSGSRRGARVRSTCKECGFASMPASARGEGSRKDERSAGGRACTSMKSAEARSAGRARQEQVQGVWGFGLCRARIARVGHASARTSAVGAEAWSAGGASICQHPRETSRCKEYGGASICHLPAPVNGSHLSSADKELSDFEGLLPIRQNI
jgi:hypothetical protein